MLFRSNAVSNGYNVFVNSSSAKNGKLDYYLFKPDEVDPQMLADRGLTLAADPTKLEQMDQSEMGKKRLSKIASQRVRDILYPAQPQEDTKGSSILFRPSTLPSAVQHQFAKDFEEFSQKNTLAANIDSLLIDWPRYYLDHDGTLPQNIDDVPAS